MEKSVHQKISEYPFNILLGQPVFPQRESRCSTYLHFPYFGEFIQGEFGTKKLHNSFEFITVLGLIYASCKLGKNVREFYHLYHAEFCIVTFNLFLFDWFLLDFMIFLNLASNYILFSTGQFKEARSDHFNFFSNFWRFWYQMKAHIFLIIPGEFYS